MSDFKCKSLHISLDNSIRITQFIASYAMKCLWREAPNFMPPYFFSLTTRYQHLLEWESSNEQVWTALWWWPPMVAGPRGPMSGVLGTGDRGLYNGVQCFMSNGHMGPHPPCGQIDWLTDRHVWKRYLPSTRLMGGENHQKILGPILVATDNQEFNNVCCLRFFLITMVGSVIVSY